MSEKLQGSRIGRKGICLMVGIIAFCGISRAAIHSKPLDAENRGSPKISGIQIAKVSVDRLLLHWQTDRPATSQVLAFDLAAEEEINTVGDLVLRTDHWVWVSGLKPATEYAFQAMSVSYAYGKAIANPVFEQTMSQAKDLTRVR
jgi:hypothetical protein